VKRAGKVWLVGAGPGDPELLTLKAARALGEADVLLVDDLANPAVLAHARPAARVVPVGKRGGCRSTPQAFIEKLMIRCARRGLTVARVKGGDPFVFGRGGEEMLALAAAGITVEIASGITAGMGAPAAFGIPVTHREVARGVTFVTGHTRDGAPVDWHALVAARTTLVIYMGIARCAPIMDALLAAGLAPDTPAAAIQNGTLATERCIIAGAAGLARAVAKAGLGSPAVLVIGEVVRLARQTRHEARDATEETCLQPHAA
jgi:uroporphyrin-III C-methyltransferase